MQSWFAWSRGMPAGAEPAKMRVCGAPITAAWSTHRLTLAISWSRLAAFGRIGVCVVFIVGVFETIAERVGSQAEQKPGVAGAFDRLSRNQRLGLKQTEAGQCEAVLQCRFQEISASEGLHGPSNTMLEDFCQSWFCAPPCGLAQSTTTGFVHPRSVGCPMSRLTGTHIEPVG